MLALFLNKNDNGVKSSIGLQKNEKDPLISPSLIEKRMRKIFWDIFYYFFLSFWVNPFLFYFHFLKSAYSFVVRCLMTSLKLWFDGVHSICRHNAYIEDTHILQLSSWYVPLLYLRKKAKNYFWMGRGWYFMHIAIAIAIARWLIFYSKSACRGLLLSHSKKSLAIT